MYLRFNKINRHKYSKKYKTYIEPKCTCRQPRHISFGYPPSEVSIKYDFDFLIDF